MNEEKSDLLGRSTCLYMKYGIKSVSMDDLARELGVSKKTIYQYVLDKEDLVKQCTRYMIEVKTQAVSDLVAQNLNAIDEILGLFKIMHGILEHSNPTVEYDIKKYCPEVYREVKQIRRQKMHAFVFQNIEKGKTNNFYRQEIDSNIIAKSYVGRVEFMLYEDYFTTEELTSPAVFMQLFLYHMHGICTPIGIEYLNQKLKNQDLQPK